MWQRVRARFSVRSLCLAVLLIALNLAAAVSVSRRLPVTPPPVPRTDLYQGTLQVTPHFREIRADHSEIIGDYDPVKFAKRPQLIQWPWLPLNTVQSWLPLIGSLSLSTWIVVLWPRRSRPDSGRVIVPTTTPGPAWTWLLVIAIGLVLGATSARNALVRYAELNSGWSWDLAYYNQWFWALTRSDEVLSVRPMASYAVEGPSVWKMNYLAPVRFILAPIYQLVPGPETLLVVHAFLFWASVPAVYYLAKEEARSSLAGFVAAVLVPSTPLLGPLAANDFRELQLAFPFVILALAGVRGRQPWLAGLGIAGMLACRQEFAVMVATFAIVPGRNPEDLGTTYRWAKATWFTGILWTLLFLLYLRITSGPMAPLLYLEQFRGPKAPIFQALGTSVEFLLLGLGTWGVLAWLEPRVGMLVVLWVWNLASGRWAIRYLSTTEWHHIRYAAPFVLIGVAAGVVGWAKLWRLMESRIDRIENAEVHVLGRRWQWRELEVRRLLRLTLVTVTFAGLLVPSYRVYQKFQQAPRPIPLAEARELQTWLQRVGPGDAVLADYALTAPLSTRRKLFAYEMDSNLPPGFPTLDMGFRWVFAKPWKVRPEILTGQGFEVVHKGETIWVYHRPDPFSNPDLKPLPERP